ncbi:MAG: T9SS type A sorting domain-containing protein [Bacteroidaceae bacterium]|nr:T9SS type A sorting domain-containing protein [Bacteroidaceae bacterium]
MKKLYLFLLAIITMGAQAVKANETIGLSFNRTGTNATSVTIAVTGKNGTAINGAQATISSSHSFKGTSNAVTPQILCPDANGNSSPTIEIGIQITGVPEGFSFGQMALDLHALNGGSNYQDNSDGKQRRWNIGATVNGANFGSLDDIDIAAGVGTAGYVHKEWEITGSTATADNGTITLNLTITKGSANEGCFIGISSIRLGEATADPTPDPDPEPEPEPEPEPDTTEGKIYVIQWKNTGTNYITEGDDQKMYVDSYDVTKRQFWQFIPTDNENCYYIKNTASGRYIGSCNLTPSSASKIYTTTTPTEYYVARTSATSGEIAGCWYMSSTDCSNYNRESSGPRALNKDGASNDVITWQAGTSRVGSYWKLIESEDLYEIRPFDASAALGTIGTRYNIESPNGKYATLSDGNVTLAAPDIYEESQEWYFAGASNTNGWQIASAMSPAAVIGVSNGTVVAQEGNSTRWKVFASKKENGYFYFTSGKDTLTIEGETLFRFNKLRSQYARNNQIYANPCGTAGTNYLTSIEIKGESVLDNLIYTASSKPSTWHVLYSTDKATVTKGEHFELTATLKSNPASSLTATAYFDWNCDGVFETKQELAISGTSCTATVSVPEWASDKQGRMRLRINSNGLDLAEDDVEGFIYDLNIKTAETHGTRTVTVGVNSWERGRATLSHTADSYAPGTALTAIAETVGNATFICWREEGNVVSTQAEYPFTVEHNTNLIAYFSPNTDEESILGIEATTEDSEVSVTQDDNTIAAHSTAAVKGITLYTIDAAKVAATSGSRLSIQGIANGLYIVRVTTENGYRNVKLYINK